MARKPSGFKRVVDFAKRLDRYHRLAWGYARPKNIIRREPRTYIRKRPVLFVKAVFSVNRKLSKARGKVISLYNRKNPIKQEVVVKAISDWANCYINALEKRKECLVLDSSVLRPLSVANSRWAKASNAKVLAKEQEEIILKESNEIDKVSIGLRQIKEQADSALEIGVRVRRQHAVQMIYHDAKKHFSPPKKRG